MIVDAPRKFLLERVVLPLAGAVSPFKTHRYLEEMLAADFDELGVQARRREQLLADLLQHAASETELYSERLPKSGYAALVKPEAFAKLPITNKQDLRQEFPRRQLARSHEGAWLRYSNTSGTTGRPLLLIQDTRDISAKYASILRSRVLAGLRPMSSQARVTPNECQPTRLDDAGAKRHGAFVMLEQQVINPYFHRRLMLPPFWGSQEPTGPVDFDDYLDRIEEFDPEVLTLYPLYAWLLASHLERTGREPPRPRGIVDFSAAVCTPSMRAKIEKAFGRRTAQGSGGCEFARYAASCEADPDRMHLAETYCYVETVRADGSLCAPGELGNVIVTSLHSLAMPIIRLEPGDVGQIIDEPCACGRKSRRLEHHGRIHSLMQTGQGRWVSGRDVWERLFRVPGLSLFELRQADPTHSSLSVVEDAGATLDRSALDRALVDLLGRDATVEVERVSQIRTQASGKLQLVHSASFERFRPPSERDRQVPVN